jgi:hypothetical protein
LQEVKAVSHLDRSRRAQPRAFGVRVGAVARDDLDPGACPQPGGKTLRRVVLEYINRAVRLQVDQQRCVAVAAPKRELVHTHNTRGWRIGKRRGSQQTQERVGARGHPGRACQSCPGLSTAAIGKRQEKGRRIERAPSVPWQYGAEALRERAAGALRVGTTEAPNGQDQPHLPAPPREVLWAPSVAVVYLPPNGATGGAGGFARLTMALQAHHPAFKVDGVNDNPFFRARGLHAEVVPHTVSPPARPLGPHKLRESPKKGFISSPIWPGMQTTV